MQTAADLRALPGDSILEKYDRLLRHIEAQRLVSTDDRVLITATPNGQHVTVAQRGPSVPIPLQVRQIGADAFGVAEGYINGRLPLIQTISQGEKPLVDEDGVPHAPARLPQERPILVVAEVKFRGDFSLESIKITTKRPAELIRTGTANYISAGAGQITGHIPLAFSRGSRFIQFTLHNLQVRAYQDGGARRVIYWPA